jgi:Rad3-related DNA helicase
MKMNLYLWEIIKAISFVFMALGTGKDFSYITPSLSLEQYAQLSLYKLKQSQTLIDEAVSDKQNNLPFLTKESTCAVLTKVECSP